MEHLLVEAIYIDGLKSEEVIDRQISSQMSPGRWLPGTASCDPSPRQSQSQAIYDALYVLRLQQLSYRCWTLQYDTCWC